MKLQTFMNGEMTTHKCPDCKSEDFDAIKGVKNSVKCRSCKATHTKRAISGGMNTIPLLDVEDHRASKGYSR
jgi:ribosomal protein L37AE/L43A